MSASPGCRCLLAASLFPLAFATSCGPSASDGAASEPPPARVAVAALGRLTPSGRLRRIAAPAGERVKEVRVEESARVTKNAVLAVLESHDERLAARDLARRNLEVAERQTTVLRRQGAAQILRAELTVQQLVATNPARLQAMAAEVQRREAFLGQQRSELSRLEPLFERKVIDEEMVVRQRHVTNQAEQSMIGGRADLERLQSDTVTELGLARASLEVTRADLDRQIEALRLDPLRAELDLAQAQLERTIIKAPSDAIVLRILSRAGEVIGDGAILTLGDTSEMIALVEVYESDLQYLRVGQTATLTSTALPGKLTGKLRHIGQIVARNQVYDLDPAADQDVRVIEVEVALDDSSVAARFVSLQVDVVISVD